MKKTLTMILLATAGSLAMAKLPPLSEEAQAKAAEAKAKADHAAKVDAWKLCLAQDKAAAHYRRTAKDAQPATATPACADPGAFQPPKPIEAAGAHSPAATAVAPPADKQAGAPDKK